MTALEKLKNDRQYHLMVAVMGEYDDSKDYMGPENDWKSKIIPRTLWGIDCNIAGYKHDFRYFVGGTEDDREKADKIFKDDLYKIINNHKCNWPWGTRWLHIKLARRRAVKYYLAVKLLGKGNFNYHD